MGRGLRITLIESRPRLGGRASSFTDPATGELVDNCQHVSMSCCTNLADFCRRVGTDGLFRHERTLVFLGTNGRVSKLTAGRLPAPFHLAGSFLKASYLTLAEKLRARGYSAAAINGDVPQAVRERTVNQLKAAKLDILVATDVAARGLDVERISHVVNFDIPLDPEAYVHRIGRTGRAGRSGDAISFVTPRERRLLGGDVHQNITGASRPS